MTEREQFESWHFANWPRSCFIRNEQPRGGDYMVDVINKRWEGWKARRRMYSIGDIAGKSSNGDNF